MTRVRNYRRRDGTPVSGYSRSDRGLGVAPKKTVIPSHIGYRDSYGIWRLKPRRRP